MRTSSSLFARRATLGDTAAQPKMAASDTVWKVKVGVDLAVLSGAGTLLSRKEIVEGL
jgi:hypothetical protein